MSSRFRFTAWAHDAVRSGEVLWNSYTDLGANFIASYSFYLLFSPFFWLTLPFPSEMVPYLMAPLLMLKTACWHSPPIFISGLVCAPMSMPSSAASLCLFRLCHLQHLLQPFP